jgi:hypothetical protein
MAARKIGWDAKSYGRSLQGFLCRAVAAARGSKSAAGRRRFGVMIWRLACDAKRSCDGGLYGFSCVGRDFLGKIGQFLGLKAHSLVLLARVF